MKLCSITLLCVVDFCGAQAAGVAKGGVVVYVGGSFVYIYMHVSSSLPRSWGLEEGKLSKGSSMLSRQRGEPLPPLSDGGLSCRSTLCVRWFGGVGIDGWVGLLKKLALCPNCRQPTTHTHTRTHTITFLSSSRPRRTDTTEAVGLKAWP